MKKISYFVIIALLLWGCSDTVENTEKPVKTTDASMQISFSLKGANDAITSVTGELQSSVHDNISFNFNISGETASYNIEHVQAGDWTLVVKAYNAQTELRHQGEEDISIVAGQVNSVSIVLDQTTGTAGFYVSWGSSGSVNLVIDLTNNPGSVNTYTYSLERDGFNSISESEAVAGLSIEAEVHDLKDGIWKLSIFAKNGAAVVAAGEGQIEVLNGLVTKVNASYNVVGPKVDISSQFDTQSGYADRVYVGDEAFRNFLIVKHHFTDLHSPYVLRSDAESVTQLEISTLDFSLFGSKAVDDHLNAQALTAFTNLEEIVLYGFTFKGLEFTNHPNLRTLGGIFITADYLDLSGAPNLKQLVLASLAIGWVDISNSTSLQILEIGDVDKQKGNGGFYYSYSFQVGAVYVDPSMVGSQLLMDTYYPKFITEADAAALTKVKIPDSDAKRIFLSHGLKILKGDYVDQADLDLVFDIQYYNPFNFRKGFGGYVYYAPIKSDAFLALVPNLNSLYLDDQNFTELDFSANTNLVYLEIANCHFLTSLDISMLNLGSFGLAKQKSERARRSKSGYPIELYITNNTQLASVNIGNQPSLAAVDISGNYYLTSLDVTGLAYAYDLYLDDNSLTSISMNSNNYYYTLDLSRNKFASLSFSKLTNLYYLYIQENSQMTSVTLDSLPNLSYMYASDNTNLSTVDFSSFANTNLYYLDLNYANLTSIDLSNFPNLSYLYLDENDIQPSIDLSLLGPFYAVSLNNNPSLATVYYNSAYQNSGNISFGSSVTLIDLNVIGKQ